MKYQKTEIATSMLETAIELFLDNKCKFSATQLAAASEEVMAGLIDAKSYDYFWCMAGEESGVTCW